MAIQIQIRNDTAAQWTSVNPLLSQGEMGIERETTYIKIGDGITRWNNLAYASASFAANGGSGGSGSLSASYADFALSASCASYAQSASYGTNFFAPRVTSSYVSASVAMQTNQLTASNALIKGIIFGTASYAMNGGSGIGSSVSASWASASISASTATNAITAAVVPVNSVGDNQYYTPVFTLGSTTQPFNVAGGGTSTFGFNPGTSTLQTTNISAATITASLFGTASYANKALSASYALTASFALNGGGMAATYTSSLYGTASWAITASLATSLPYGIALDGANVVNDLNLDGGLGTSYTHWDGNHLTIANEDGDINLYANGNVRLVGNQLLVGTASYANTASWVNNAVIAKSSSITDIGNPDTNYALVFVDGAGNPTLKTNGGGTSVFSINPGSGVIKATSFLGNLTGTASWANNAVNSISASYLNGPHTGSTFGTASWAITSSYSVTASYVMEMPPYKSGKVLSTAFSGSPMTSSVTFITPFTDGLYSVALAGGNARAWTVENIVSGGFVISTNANQQPDEDAYWLAIKHGESN